MQKKAECQHCGEEDEEAAGKISRFLNFALHPCFIFWVLKK